MRTILLTALVWGCVASPAPAQDVSAREALAPFFTAPGPDARRATIADVLGRVSDPAALLDALRAGPDLPRAPARGRIDEVRTQGERSFPWFAMVPESYDPGRAYPVRFYLHGGISRAEPDQEARWWQRPERVASEEYISVFPASWRSAAWWTATQVDNLHGILDALKHRYNVDEDRVSVTGVSDGGTGVYFLGFRDVTPWSALLPFIGHAAVLLNPGVGADGPFSVVNLANKPLYIVNGTDDRLYPVRSVEPFIAAYQAVGVELVWRPQEGGGHDTSWWPAEAEGIERFLETHPRDPYPVRIVWETERVDRYARAHWIVLDELGHPSGESAFSDPVVLEDPGDAGRVVASREGNRVVLETHGVSRLRVLVSPDAFDLLRPLTVIANDVTVFEGMVRPDARTLLEWAAEDFDRRQLYVAEIPVDLTGGA